MTLEWVSSSDDPLLRAPAPLAPPSWLARAVRTIKFKTGLVVVLCALLSGAFSTYFVIRESQRVVLDALSGVQFTPLDLTDRIASGESVLQALQGVERRAWVFTGAVVFLCVLFSVLTTLVLTRPIVQLRDRARKVLVHGSVPGAGWPTATGEIGDLVSVLRQVTVENARAMENQLTMVQQLQAILTNASVGIMITRNGKFELVGRHVCQMFGYAEAELLGQRTSTIYRSHEAYLELGPRMRADFAANGHFDGELVMRRRSGQEFWVHMLGRGVVPGDPGGGTIWILEDISQAREARDRLSWTATHDSLTGLVNRKEFESRLEQAMQQFQLQQVCVMFIDLDKFKAVNDSAGHAAGDEVLRSVAAVFESTVRQADTVGRLGGDEFAILLPGCGIPRAQEIAEQLRAGVAAYRLRVDGQVFAVGTSIGVVEVGPGLPTMAAVLEAADSACYAAKRGGRDRVVTHRQPTPGGAVSAV